MSQTYTLEFINKSSNSSTSILYQKDTKPASGEYSLAWLAAPAAPQATVEFKWEQEYGFVWGPMEDLKPGNVFRSMENLPADLSTTNAITLAEESGSLKFTDQRPGPEKDSLLILNGSTLPMNSAVEGISMSGNGVFVTQAQPNSEIFFSTNPEYWIAFGHFTQGEVLNSKAMFTGEFVRSKRIYGLPQKVEFPNGVFAMTATLNPDNSWTIAPS